MKKITITILLITTLSTTFFIGCDSLNQYPISEKSSTTFFSDEDQFNQAIAGCYYILRQYKLRDHIYFRLTESRSDNTFQLQDYDDGQTSRFEETSALPLLNDMWAASYNAINRCNTVLENLEKVDFEMNRDQVEGEARLIRAMVYFDLVRIYAGVPIIDKTLTLSESYTVERSTMQEVYNFIKEDLTKASDLLPSSTISGRFNKYVAIAYMGKVLVFESGYPLKNNKWNEAKDWLKRVIDSNQFEFFPNFEDIFLYANESGKQSVASFTCLSGVGNQGNPFPSRNAPRDIAKSGELGIIFGGNAACLHISEDLVNSFESNDFRLPISIQQVWKHTNGNLIDNEPYCRKYQDGPVSTAHDWDIDYIDYRFDEVLLLYAECLNELGFVADGESFNIVNNFRLRAGLAPKTSAEIQSQDDFRLWIENERRWEFIGENIRWFDLVRTDRALDVMNAFLTPYNYGGNVTKDRYFYPIPLRATNENPNLLIDPGFK